MHVLKEKDKFLYGYTYVLLDLFGFKPLEMNLHENGPEHGMPLPWAA